MRATLTGLLRDRRLARLPLVVMMLLAVACDGAADPSAGWTITVDTLPSGAVQVVNQPPAAGIRPTWVVEEEVRIGALDADGPESFGQIKGLVVDGEGRIFALDAQAQEVRVFGPDGRYLRTLGRRGEGPGELRNANGIMRAPDGRIWVVDPQLARMSVFDPEAGFETSYRWEVRSWGWVWEGRFDGGGRVLEPSMAQWDGERWHALRIYDDRMQPLDSLPIRPMPAPMAEAPSAFRWEAAGVWGYIPVPFFPQERRTLDPGPAYWSTGAGDPSYRLARWVPGEDTVLVVQSRRPAVPVTPAERDSAIAAIQDLLRERGSGTRPDWSRIPDVHPAVTGLFLADDGDLWARVTTPDPDMATWDVYAPDGRYQGTAVAPLRPYPWVPPVVRGDRFWAVVTDDLDVQYLVAARLRKDEG